MDRCRAGGCLLARVLAGVLSAFQQIQVASDGPPVEDGDVSRVSVVGMNRVEFRQLRRLAGLTMAETASRLGVSVRTVSRWERGHSRIDRWKAEEIRQVLCPEGWAKEGRQDTLSGRASDEDK